MLGICLVVVFLSLVELVDCARVRAPARHYTAPLVVLVGYGLPVLLAFCCSSGR